jgi:hypothetical protein
VFPSLIIGQWSFPIRAHLDSIYRPLGSSDLNDRGLLDEFVTNPQSPSFRGGLSLPGEEDRFLRLDQDFW